MKLQDALQNVSTLYLDTAPVIYYIEGVATYFNIVDLVFQQIESGRLSAIASPVTLSECLVVPLRLNDLVMQQKFVALLTNTEGISMVDINMNVGQISAELRSRYGLKLPDAFQIASAIAANCDAFLTNDERLKQVQELNVIVIKELEP